MKITVCKGCKKVMQAYDADTGKPACVICVGISKYNSIPEEVDIPEEASCSYGCGSTAKWNEEKKMWVLNLSSKGGWNATYDGNREVAELPFLNVESKTFYCGCWGWE